MTLPTLTIGILALQGAFREHAEHFEALNSSDPSSSTGSGISSSSSPIPPLRTLLIRTPSDLSRAQALILPGGESTSLSLGAARSGLLEPLREWVAQGRPTWGTCAGMILLAQRATGGKRGGMGLVGGVDVSVARNGYGSQVFSFEAPLEIPCLGSAEDPARSFPGVFIRAPVVDALLGPGPGRAVVKEPVGVTEKTLSSSTPPSDADAAPTDTLLRISVAAPLDGPRPPLEILATLDEVHVPTGADLSLLAPPSPAPSPVPSPSSSSAPAPASASASSSLGTSPSLHVPPHRIVAARQGNIMVTSFHPELTDDKRLHDYFVRSIVVPAVRATETAEKAAS